MRSATRRTAPSALPPARLTFLETVDVMYKLMTALLDGLAAAVAFPMLGNRRAKRFRTHVSHAVLRDLSSRLTVRQTQLGSTTTAYHKYAKSRGIIPQTVASESGLHGHWVGSSDASKVLVWFHGIVFTDDHYSRPPSTVVDRGQMTGGGYYAPASSAHFEFLDNLANVVRGRLQEDFAAFVPSYTLAPHARYPTQLREGLEAVRDLVEKKGKLLENIVIGGDSAGGNLVLGILSHMSHPHPNIPVNLRGCLSGALMFSPWVSNDRTWRSVQRNKLKDCVTLVPTDISTEHFLGDNDDWDNYTEPIRAPSEWWTDIKSRNLLVVSGEDEIMTDAHRACGRILQTANPDKTETVIAAGEGHAAPILDLMLGDHSEFESGKRIEIWLSSIL